MAFIGGDDVVGTVVFLGVKAGDLAHFAAGGVAEPCSFGGCGVCLGNRAGRGRF